MTHVTYRLTARNWDQLRNPTLGNRVSTTFNFYTIIISYTHGTVFVRIVASRIFCPRILHVIVTLVTKAPRKVGHLPPGQTPTAPWISAPGQQTPEGAFVRGQMSVYRRSVWHASTRDHAATHTVVHKWNTPRLRLLPVLSHYYRLDTR